MKNNIFIFDFDGTIADTHHYIIHLSNRLASEFGYNLIRDEEIESLKDKTTQEVIKHLRVPMLKIPMIVSRAKKEFKEDTSKLKPIRGIENVLYQLHASGVKIGILSSNSLENIKGFLSHHKIDIFDFIHSTSKVWSKNTSLKQLMEKHKLKKNDIIYIGDEIRDIVAAQKIGVAVAAVTWGYNSAKALVKYHPDYLLHTPRELLSLLRKK